MLSKNKVSTNYTLKYERKHFQSQWKLFLAALPSSQKYDYPNFPLILYAGLKDCIYVKLSHDSVLDVFLKYIYLLCFIKRRQKLLPLLLKWEKKPN